MTNRNAYAITTVHRRNPNKPNGLEIVAASTATKPSVFKITSEEFDQLEALGAVRQATTDEMALARAQATNGGNSADFDEEETTLVGGIPTSQLASNAPVPPVSNGDPNATPPAANRRPVRRSASQKAAEKAAEDAAEQESGESEQGNGNDENGDTSEESDTDTDKDGLDV